MKASIYVLHLRSALKIFVMLTSGKLDVLPQFKVSPTTIQDNLMTYIIPAQLCHEPGSCWNDDFASTLTSCPICPKVCSIF